MLNTMHYLEYFNGRAGKEIMIISHHLSLNQHTIISATMLLYFNGFDITLKTSSMTYQVHLSNFYQGNIDIRCVHNLLSVVRSEQMMSFIYDTESRQSKF